MKIHSSTCTNLTNFMTPGGLRARFVQLLSFWGLRSITIFPKKDYRPFKGNREANNMKFLFFIDSYSVVSRWSRAQQYKILVEPPSTLKHHCELKTSLTDKPDTVLKSSDSSEQNQWGWFFDFSLKFFAQGPYVHLIIDKKKTKWEARFFSKKV